MVDVIAAACVLIDDKTDQLMLQKRRKGQIYAGFYEFPGGKIEQGETPLEAALREVEEEVGVRLESAQPLTFIYERRTKESPEKATLPVSKVVLVCVFIERVDRLEVLPKEGQEVLWDDLSAIQDYPLLPANYSLIDDIAAYLNRKK